jgi:hypothetical protein
MRYFIFVFVLFFSGCGATSKSLNLNYKKTWDICKNVAESERFPAFQGGEVKDLNGEVVDPIYNKDKGYIKVEMNYSSAPIFSDTKICRMDLKEINQTNTLVTVNVFIKTFVIKRRHRQENDEKRIMEKIINTINKEKQNRKSEENSDPEGNIKNEQN